MLAIRGRGAERGRARDTEGHAAELKHNGPTWELPK